MKTRIIQTITALIIVITVSIAFIKNNAFEFDATNQTETTTIAEDPQVAPNYTSKKTLQKLTR